MTVRLDKLISDRTTYSRKEIRIFARKRRIVIDGEVVREVDRHVDPTITVFLDGEPLPPLPEALAWHKPAGVLSTMADPWGRQTLATALPLAWRDRFHPVGRLDQDTTGLLLFSADGQLTQWLLHPRRAVPRTYEATIGGVVPADLADRLAAGVETSLGTFTGEVEAVEGRVVRVTVCEGKHRMVRRMLNNAGAPVAALHRVAFGPIALGDLAEGARRPLTAAELTALRQAPSSP